VTSINVREPKSYNMGLIGVNDVSTPSCISSKWQTMKYSAFLDHRLGENSCKNFFVSITNLSCWSYFTRITVSSTV